MAGVITVSLEVVFRKSGSGMPESLSASWQAVFDYKFLLRWTHRYRHTLECVQILSGAGVWLLFNNLSQ